MNKGNYSSHILVYAKAHPRKTPGGISPDGAHCQPSIKVPPFFFETAKN